MTCIKTLARIGLLAGAAALGAGGAVAQETPQYGGSLSIANVYRTVAPLSFDAADWNWKFNQDLGLVNESLLVADLSKSRTQGGPYAFISDAYLPMAAVRGELAESWQMQDNPQQLVIKLRKGVMFPEKKGVMASRELTADDVVYSFNRYNNSPKKVANYFDHIDKVEATDKYTVVIRFNKYMAEWDYRFGWGYYSSIVPKEVVEAGANNWRNANGTGPFMLTNYVQGNTLAYKKNPVYWDSITLGGKSYKLPFVETLSYRVIKDESTALTALRTGKLDIMEAVPWSAVDELKKSAPPLKWNRWLSTLGNYVALRTDTKPFDDLRVRRALNMAVDRDQIIKTFYGGQAEVLGYPMTPDFGPYYEKLATMPEAVKELFTYNPDKAKKLLAEAGYPNGFSVKVQTSSVNTNNEVLSIVASQLAKVGVKLEIQVLEYPAYLSAMTTKTHAPAYFMNQGHTNPTTSLRKAFGSGQIWNPSQYSDKAFDAKLEAAQTEPDEAKRQELLRAMTREILEKAPHIWLPTPYVYTAWWPWVKNYSGELRAGAERPGPIHARIWVDQAMKKKLGF
ncbi:peptide ABC transporter substrate-binding protein [Comamonas serinivorans]|uniref:Peptide ABC transporter substrate-binding protein n=1 Tax=Comamonas serinivorans TaxID=1082851 RepID=A0A1Y0EN11_9BURK|nr:ABC transporter substrate-binding protein [Comamonas serinivorans]ARU04831.1 peptide ABC transporter substrate-binding protein [Comamonas serinivorans]